MATRGHAALRDHGHCNPDLSDAMVRHPAAGFEVAIDVANLQPRLRRPGDPEPSLVMADADQSDGATSSLEVPHPWPGSAPVGSCDNERRIDVGAGGSRRLRIGRPTVETSVLERVDRWWGWLSRNVVKIFVRVLTSTRPGRVVGLAVEELRPGLAARVLDG